MPANRPQRPTPGVSLVLPRVEDEATQRAFDRVAVVSQQVQSRLGTLAGQTGRYLGTQVLVGSGAYVPAPGTTMVRAKVLGGGGGGGGAGGGANAAVGAGGGSGVLLDVAQSALGTSTTGGTFTCGAGGVGGTTAGGPGLTGGDTTIVINGVTYTAKGGTGGGGMVSSPLAAAAAGAGGVGSTSGGAVVASSSWIGDFALEVGGGSFPGSGASSTFGTGGAGSLATVGAGSTATGFGAGGGGAHAGVAGFVGGDGSAGVIVIEEYS